jgi:hypothetical protein
MLEYGHLREKRKKNPDAIFIADALDHERKSQGTRDHGAGMFYSMN